jgi:hypothetical protein
MTERENGFPPEYHNVLSDCLDAVLAGRQTVAQCVAEHPDHAEQLQAELRVALLTSRLKAPRMPRESVLALEERLRAQMAERPPTTARQPARVIRFPAISRAAAAILIVLLLAFGGGGGVVAASADSVPGDTLYGIKRAWENVIVLIATVTGRLGEVWLHLAQTRLDEMMILAERGQPGDELLDDLQRATSQAISQSRDEDLPQLVIFLAETHEALDGEKVTIEDRRARQELIEVIAPVIETHRELVPPPPDRDEPDAPGSAPGDLPATATATPTATFTPTVTPTTTSTSTATPRIPVTPTRTPTRTATPTPLPSVTPIPSATWTPLPSPTPGPGGIVPQAATATPPGAPAPVVFTPTPPLLLSPSPTPTWYPWPQATRDAFYLTRTAEVEGASWSAQTVTPAP